MSQHLEFRRPWLVRSFFVIFTFVTLGSLPALLPTLIKEHQANTGMLLYYLVICVPISILSLWFSGPDDISFDLEQKTYRWVKGYPFLARTRTGSFEDLWGVYLARTQGSERYFCVGINWRSGRNSITVNRFYNELLAEQFAEDLMTKLGLPKVMPPRNLRSQT